MIRQICLLLDGRCQECPEAAVVLGSGLDAFSEAVEPICEIPYSDIPYMSASTVQSHHGSLLLGRLNGKVIAVMRGRIHLYEGHSPADVVRLLRALIIWGATRVVLTNAAGGINPDMVPGDLMLIEDQINLQGVSSLTGFNDERLGTRFPDMSNLYDEDLNLAVQNAARQIGLKLHRGVYVGMHGPSFETPAEIVMLRRLGGDAVGMSTVLEAEAANHMGAKVTGITFVSNYAARKGAKITHEDVSQAALTGCANLTALLKAIV